MITTGNYTAVNGIWICGLRSAEPMRKNKIRQMNKKVDIITHLLVLGLIAVLAVIVLIMVASFLFNVLCAISMQQVGGVLCYYQF